MAPPALTKILVSTLAAVAVAAGFAGCAPQAEEPSSDSGPLVIYAGRDEALIGPLIDLFSEETGIETEVRFGKTPDLAALLLEEGERTPAQVFVSQDAGALGALSTAGLLATLPSELTEQVPAGFTSTDDSWIGVTGRARVIAYDTQMIDEAEVPDSVTALTAPEFNGKVAFAPGNASFQAFVTALRVLEGESAADEWVAAMAANNPVLTESNGQSLDLVNSGEVELALINHYYWYERAAELGEDNMRAGLKFLPGDAGGIVNVSGAAILKNAAENPSAQAFLEFLLSETAQTYFVENTFEYPLTAGVAAPAGLPSLESLVNEQLDLADLESLAETQAMLMKHGLL